MKIILINQTEFSLAESSLEKICLWLVGEIDFNPREVSLVFVDDKEISQLNEKYYGREGVTDVLAFPYGDDTAEIFLNLYQQRRQAADFANSFNEEVVENIIHAFLHLVGYDHTREDDGEHLARQAELMEKFAEQNFEPVVDGSQEM
ncbi:MAG: rRNA maturation RNase YbeY [bacterium]